MASLQKVMFFLLLIGPLITIHELGHFLVAKLFRVKVLRFSIGFGPRLLGFQKGETTYQIALLPLGGYVKMAGDDPSEAPKPEDVGRGFLEQEPWKRALISLAGPFTNLVFPILIFFCVFYFQSQALSSRVGQVDPESPAAAAGLKAGDRIISVDGEPVQYFDELRERIGPKWEQQVTLELERPDGKRATAMATPTKHMERVLLHEQPRGILGVMQGEPAPVVNVLDPASPAGKAGLLPLDRITEIGGVQVKLFRDLEREVSRQQGPFEVAFLRAQPLATPGAPLSVQVLHRVQLSPSTGVDLTARTGISDTRTVISEIVPGSPAAIGGLQRGDTLLAANGKTLLGWSTFERMRAEAKLQPLNLEVSRAGEKLHLSVAQKNLNEENELGKQQAVLFLGALPERTIEPGELVPLHRSAISALGKSLSQVRESIDQMIEALGGLLTAKVAFKTVGGPVMLFDIAGKSAEAGWESFLAAMALISVNLGIMNLLPVPVLDGFHVLSSAFEWIRRRPLSLRAREVANYVGLAMLLLLMAFVMKNDIMRYVLNAPG
jgi:regulator of sigma E protease